MESKPIWERMRAYLARDAVANVRRKEPFGEASRYINNQFEHPQITAPIVIITHVMSGQVTFRGLGSVRRAKRMWMLGILDFVRGTASSPRPRHADML